MLEVVNLTVRFGGVKPLDEATISFEDGICGLIGPNGAGKTTLLNVLSGFVSPSSGSVRCDGSDLLAMAPHRRARWGLRRTFQKEQIVTGLAVADNVAVAQEHTTGTQGVGVDDALELVGLSGRRRDSARLLSTVQRRLLEIARAIVGSPRIVLLDEPGAGLSDAETAQLVQIVRAVESQTQALVVLVDHDMDLVRATCSDVTVLDFGKVIGHGPTDTVLAEPAVRRAYLGSEDLP
jgi:ABC-type branched-subunit amino acid transport system ATPase component